MARCIITGDLHSQKGIFVDIALEYLDHLQSYYLQNNLDYIFFAGDMFEKASRINHEAFVPLFLKLEEMKNKNIKMIFILGNHDIYNIKNNSLVETFRPFGKVVKEIEDVLIDNKKFTFMSYTKDRTLLPETGDFLITHLDILEFSFDNAYMVNDPTHFTPDMFKDYKLVFSGHYHKYQHKKNIIFQGDPYQLSFGESGCEKGFVVLDSDTEKWEFIKYTKAPEFIKFPIEEFNDKDVRNKFVCVEIKTKVENFVKLRHILIERGAIEVIPAYSVNATEIKVGENLKVGMNNSVKVMVTEFLKEAKIENINSKKLLKLFDKVLEEV